MKKFNLSQEINLNGQKSEIHKNEFSSDELLTKEELDKIKGGEGDSDPDPIIIGGPK